MYYHIQNSFSIGNRKKILINNVILCFQYSYHDLCAMEIICLFYILKELLKYNQMVIFILKGKLKLEGKSLHRLHKTLKFLI